MKKRMLILVIAIVFIFQSCVFAAGYKTDNSTGTFLTSKAMEVISDLNAERVKYGLSPLSYDPVLTEAAMTRAVEISRKFSHTRPDGKHWSTVSNFAYAENIARGHSTAYRVMAAWLTSPGHRANIMKKSYTSVGVAAYKVNGVIHWVQLFGKG